MGFVLVVVSVLMVSVGNVEVGLADMVCSACIACGLEWLTIRTMWMAAKATPTVKTMPMMLAALLTERWQLRFNELHQSFQTVVIIHSDDMALHRLLQEEPFYSFPYRLVAEHVATTIAHGSHQVALHLILLGVILHSR